MLGRIGSAVVLIHALAKDYDLSILRQVNFDDILFRFVHPAMFPRRIKDVGFASSGPHPNPMGLAVVAFFDLPDPAQIERAWLQRLRLGGSPVSKARIAAASQAGERNQEGKQEAKKTKRFDSCTTTQLDSPPDDCRLRFDVD